MKLYGIFFAIAMVMDELRDWIALHRICWTRPQAAWDMVLRWGGVDPILRARRQDLCPILDTEWAAIEQLRRTIDWKRADRGLEFIAQKKISVTPRGHPHYPPLLNSIPDPPLLLFWRGTIPNWNAFTGIAIVGSRKASSYGREVVNTVIPQLTKSAVIISGLAFGIDAEAHRACITARGKTIAVLASGIDDITPRQHQKLGEIIIDNGALCSETPLGEPAYAAHFLSRNRIISGLARATIVIEAENRSGSLVTARHATDQGRDVFAVPGPITSPLSAGCNQLIKDGAIPLCSPADIFEEGSAQGVATVEKYGHSKPLDDTTARLFETLATGPCTANDLGERMGLPITKVLQLLTELECAGMLKVLPGGFVARN